MQEPITQTNLLDFLLDEQDVTWQTVLSEAVKSGNLDPWDIDITKLAEEFLKTLERFKQMNFAITGKMVLAAAILLKMKSSQFLQGDIANLDRIIADVETQIDQYADEEDDTDYEDEAYIQADVKPERYDLYPRTPQPRKRKVSLNDLVNALDKALEVKNRRKILDARPAPAVKAPDIVIDLAELMSTVEQRIFGHYKQQKDPLLFSSLIEENSRESKMYTFIPLLHLANARKVDLDQQEHFGDIQISEADTANTNPQST